MLTLSPPWLTFDLGQPMQILSFAPHNPGLVEASRILWREVRNADLTEDLDAIAWLGAQLEKREASDAVCFLTSRRLDAHRSAKATEDGVTATAVVTAGLSNAERIGTRLPQTWMQPPKQWGTINIALRLSCPLGLSALIEALSLVAEARTAAVLDADARLPTGPATGTGTDCIAVAAPKGSAAFAGKHTTVGHALGRAVYDATLAAVRDWQRDAGGW
ncbi:adenosylcobinamide amidohydrolase [Salipiger bermudensis]|uniref:adenosylcobinamide amidohydrolase n=1 Tax=Salipiger bermudensis TaxID=344736 RepID=UPI001CD24501|nr:adenosylcobinamide amidohydrolase [Salipiger bermudensis]MCA0961261.1 adenosylcobinamide amidohydrolase [Salipiger bermudensis]